MTNTNDIDTTDTNTFATIAVLMALIARFAVKGGGKTIEFDTGMIYLMPNGFNLYVCSTPNEGGYVVIYGDRDCDVVEALCNGFQAIADLAIPLIVDTY